MAKVKEFKPSRQRLETLFRNAIDYIAEVKEYETLEERIDFYKSIIGLTDEEVHELYLDINW